MKRKLISAQLDIIRNKFESKLTKDEREALIDAANIIRELKTNDIKNEKNNY